MHSINTRKVAKYVIMLGIVPRARDLFASGFGYLAFLMASIYGAVRILPSNHSYLRPENLGKFGLRHVIAEAANNLTLSWKNIDQIFIFIVSLSGIVVLCLQFVLLIYAYIIQPALAASMFATPEPLAVGTVGAPSTLNDIAFLLLDNVFGVPGLFCTAGGTCTDVLASGMQPFHIGLHSIFQFYSIGLLLIGVIIFLYFILVVIMETAVTGTPFGQRFQNIWVPIRLIVALGMLVPINYGLNSGQYITLFSAKAGSGFATNAWVLFNNTIKSGGMGNPAGETETLVGLPKTPDITPVVQFMSLVHGCAYTYWKRQDMIGANAQSLDMSLPHLPPGSESIIKPYMVKTAFPWSGDQRTNVLVEESTPYTDALDFYENEDIIIRFGMSGYPRVGPPDPRYNSHLGYTEPSCGEIRITIGDLSNRGQGATYGGGDQIQNFYFNLIKTLWYGIPSIGNAGNNNVPANLLIKMSQRHVELNLEAPDLQCRIGCSLRDDLPNCPDNCNDEISTDLKGKLVSHYKAILASEIEDAWEKYNENAIDREVSNEILNRGWGGAGIWYNKIAQMNGAFIGAIMSIPTPTLFPLLMEESLRKKCREDSNCASGLESFTPDTSTETLINFNGGVSPIVGAEKFVTAMNNLFRYWAKDDSDYESSKKTVTGNVFEDTINLIFGTEGLFDMRGKNKHIHPLAQLSAVGKGLVDSAIRNVAVSSLAGFSSGRLASFNNATGGALDMMSKFLASTAIIGLTAGIVLYYILPFLPFLYFYFAVGSWVKGVFEAMVGTPLWALAHLRIDGEGLPGDAASNGYFLIFDIFVRPIRIVFGLVASMVIFTAQIRFLNFIWSLVATNLTGYEENPNVTIISDYTISRGPIDQFFFTVIYTIIVYMLAVSSFKLIDRIPHLLLRWMGVSVSGFADVNEESKEGFTKYASLGGLTVGQKTAGGLQKFATEMGR